MCTLQPSTNIYLDKTNSKVKLHKCEFSQEISWSPNQSKLNPKDIKLNHFLVLLAIIVASYLISPKFQNPLIERLRKYIPFVIDTDCKSSFSDLKKETILIHPNFDEPFLFTTDAFAFALEAVLPQGPVSKFVENPLCG